MSQGMSWRLRRLGFATDPHFLRFGSCLLAIPEDTVGATDPA